MQQAVTQALPSDVRVLTKDEFVGLIISFWGTSKPVGYVFGLGMVVGFLIGVAICYQILYTDIVDNLPQFATLKAIGYHNRQLVVVVLEKALYLSVLGFIPGLVISFFAYAFLQVYSGIRMELTSCARSWSCWPRSPCVWSRPALPSVGLSIPTPPRCSDARRRHVRDRLQP